MKCDEMLNWGVLSHFFVVSNVCYDYQSTDFLPEKKREKTEGLVGCII